MLLLIMAATSTLQPEPASARGPQRLDPLSCSAQSNYVTKERLHVTGATFRFSGRITAGELRPDDFAPRAMISLLQEEPPEEELSAVLSVQPATPRRYDVTVRRLINDELRQRSIVGRVPSRQSVPFEVEVTAGREAVFRLGAVVTRVPLGDLDPSAIVLGCSAGDFRFDNLEFN